MSVCLSVCIDLSLCSIDFMFHFSLSSCISLYLCLCLSLPLFRSLSLLPSLTSLSPTCHSPTTLPLLPSSLLPVTHLPFFLTFSCTPNLFIRFSLLASQLSQSRYVAIMQETIGSE